MCGLDGLIHGLVWFIDGVEIFMFIYEWFIVCDESFTIMLDDGD